MTFPPWGRYLMDNDCAFDKYNFEISEQKNCREVHVNGLFSPSFEETSSDLLPDCHEGKSKEKAQGAAKLSNQGGERVKQNFLLDLGCMGCRPEAYE